MEILIVDRKTMGFKCLHGKKSGQLEEVSAQFTYGWQSPISTEILNDFMADNSPKTKEQLKFFLISYQSMLVSHQMKNSVSPEGAIDQNLFRFLVSITHLDDNGKPVLDGFEWKDTTETKLAHTKVPLYRSAALSRLDYTVKSFCDDHPEDRPM
uniref:Uncharacterized protein n=1 Tax=Ditylenchus dipsaci TaxID=166011 RepID=A0A915D8R4_9BILA